jgi:hypothetical protein
MGARTVLNIERGAICVEVGVPVKVLDGNIVLNRVTPLNWLVSVNVLFAVKVAKSPCPMVLVINWKLLFAVVMVLVGNTVLNVVAPVTVVALAIVAVPANDVFVVTTNSGVVIVSPDMTIPSPVSNVIIPFIDLSIVCPPLVYDILLY